MDRWLRFSGAGAHLLWRVKGTAHAVPFRQVRTLKDGSELVLPRESRGMLGNRRRDAGHRALAPLPDTVARLVCSPSSPAPAAAGRRAPRSAS
jgi:hypothetical protein